MRPTRDEFRPTVALVQEAMGRWIPNEPGRSVYSPAGEVRSLYAQTGVLRAVADILPLFDSTPHNRRVVMGGDLNVFDQTSDRVMHEREGDTDPDRVPRAREPSQTHSGGPGPCARLPLQGG